MIPYGRHQIDEDDISAVADVLRRGALTQGPKVAAFEQAIAERVNARFAVAVSSGTAGLHLACLAAGLSAGDCVITSPITFVASSNCALYVGASPSFADIDPSTLNLSAIALSPLLGCIPGKLAVIPVHFGGLPCDMPGIAALAKKSNAIVIEDASHALGATYQDGSPVGNCRYSNMTVFSFHPVKLIAAGEGGMITTNDEKLYRRLVKLRSHGIERSAEEFIFQDQAYEDGELNPWYYEMQDLGFNYRITDIQCALALSQLTKLDHFLERRRQIATQYDQAFARLPNVSLPQNSLRGLSANHLYVLRIDFAALRKTRRTVMRALAELGIGSQVHYIPVHLQPIYQRLGFVPGAFPESEAYYKGALTIPLFSAMTNEQVERVITGVRQVLDCKK